MKFSKLKQKRLILAGTTLRAEVEAVCFKEKTLNLSTSEKKKKESAINIQNKFK